MDKEKFLQWLENEMRIYREMGEEFKERLLELENVWKQVVNGEFDVTK